jgi:RNA recognition motif-containing protein
LEAAFWRPTRTVFWTGKGVSVNIYVGNLSYDVDERELQEAFEAYGQVESARIIKDMYSGRSKGFGFVEMPSETEASSAIEALNGKELKGRPIKVNKARPRFENRGGGGRPRGDGDRGGWRSY